MIKIYLCANKATSREESPEKLPSIASTRGCTRTKHVFTWRQTSAFLVSNFEVFPPYKCEVPSTVVRCHHSKKCAPNLRKSLHWHIESRKSIGDPGLLQRSRWRFILYDGESQTTVVGTSHLGGKTSKFDTRNAHVKVGAHEGTGRRDLLQGLVPCRVYTVGSCCGDKSLEVFTWGDLLHCET